jgi:hypothetical protein
MLLILLPAACLAATMIEESSPYSHPDVYPSPGAPLTSSRRGRLLGGSWRSWTGPTSSRSGAVPVPHLSQTPAAGSPLQVYREEDGGDAAGTVNDERSLNLFGLNFFNPFQLLNNPFAIDGTLLNGETQIAK